MNFYDIVEDVIPWVLGVLMAVCLVVLGYITVLFIHERWLIHKEGHVETGIVVDKWFTPSHMIGVVGRGGHYVPDSWSVRVYGKRSISNRDDLEDFDVTHGGYIHYKVGDSFP